MTLYWWMHWFWITFEIISCIASAHSKVVTSTEIPELVSTTVTNRPLRRNIKSVDQTSHIQSQIPVLTVTTPTKKLPSDTSRELTQKDKNSTIIKCVYNINHNVTINNLTLSQKNESNLLCNRSVDDLNVNDTNFKNKNLTDEDISSSNMSTYFLSTKASLDVENNNVTSTTSISGLSITGITFGVLLFVALICATSFMLYRRGFMNKPQTLNDKCSNLDSSGYIDDSSIRDNSEEMYSLDNDSFLNSLEAMTIQNYWTDNLKHTKL